MSERDGVVKSRFALAPKSSQEHNREKQADRETAERREYRSERAPADMRQRREEQRDEEYEGRSKQRSRFAGGEGQDPERYQHQHRRSRSRTPPSEHDGREGGAGSSRFGAKPKKSRFSDKPSVPEVSKPSIGAANQQPPTKKLNKYEAALGADLPRDLESLQKAAEQLENQDSDLDPYALVTADKEYIYFPGQPPKKRKHANKWRDATDEEIKQQLNQYGGVMDQSDKFFEEFMRIADKNLMKNLNPFILNSLQDHTKIKKKMYIPKNPGVNYIGLLIGPQGHYQKRLEEESECKILIRGKGSQKQGSAPQPDDEDDQHVLIIGESIESVQKASKFVERILNSDEETRDKIRKEQLSVAAQLQDAKGQGQSKNQPQTIDDVCKQVGLEKCVDDSMMTPYGPPSALAYIIPVPHDVVGLIIGKGGETIRQLQLESGAKVQVAKENVAATGMRNVFVEGPDDKYRKAKEMIDDIVRNHQIINNKPQVLNPNVQVHVGDANPFYSEATKDQIVKFQIPDRMVGLVIGKGTETLKSVAMKSNTKIFVPQRNPKHLHGDHDGAGNQPLTRTVEILGKEFEQNIAKQLIQELIDGYEQSQRGGGDHGSRVGNTQLMHGYQTGAQGYQRQNSYGQQAYGSQSGAYGQGYAGSMADAAGQGYYAQGWNPHKYDQSGVSTHGSYREGAGQSQMSHQQSSGQYQDMYQPYKAQAYYSSTGNAHQHRGGHPPAPHSSSRPVQSNFHHHASRQYPHKGADEAGAERAAYHHNSDYYKGYDSHGYGAPYSTQQSDQYGNSYQNTGYGGRGGGNGQRR